MLSLQGGHRLRWFRLNQANQDPPFESIPAGVAAGRTCPFLGHSRHSLSQIMTVLSLRSELLSTGVADNYSALYNSFAVGSRVFAGIQPSIHAARLKSVRRTLSEHRPISRQPSAGNAPAKHDSHSANYETNFSSKQLLGTSPRHFPRCVPTVRLAHRPHSIEAVGSPARQKCPAGGSWA